MRALVHAIPDADVLVSLEPEELGAKLIFVLRGWQDSYMSLGGLLAGLTPPAQEPLYPRPKIGEVKAALIEAWCWLQAQALIVPLEGPNGQNGFVRLSRRAERFENPAEFSGFAAARLLPKDLLHPAISEKVWLSFMRGDWAASVFEAMRTVEIRLRQATCLPREWPAVKVARAAFDPQQGPLRDREAEAGERQAMSDLFAGALGTFKNPYSHRELDLDNPAEAAAPIMFASYLLRLIDERSSA